ncbi:hypothetical protein Tco_0767100 [Tanacetum coccineum]
MLASSHYRNVSKQTTRNSLKESGSNCHQKDKAKIFSWTTGFQMSPEASFITRSKLCIRIFEKYGMESSGPMDTSRWRNPLDEDTQGKKPQNLPKALPCYADHAGYQDTGRSTFGCMPLLGDRLVCLVIKRAEKHCVISSMEANIVHVLAGCAQVLFG